MSDMIARNVAAALLYWFLIAIVWGSAASIDDANRACDRVGMETVHSSISRGKHSETFYMCRDSAGLIHALPEASK